MPKIKQKVHLITEQQRSVLVKYLSEQPYKEVAVAIQILAQAPATTVNVDVNQEQLDKMYPDGIPEEIKQAIITEGTDDGEESPQIELVK